LWGPGDGITSGAGAGLDELVAIFDIDRRAWWTLLDASGDVVAIVDDGASTAHGYGTGSSSTSDARLCAQFCYDAYGSLISTQGLHPFPDPRTGHKGLHLDRLDGGVADPVTGAPIARHEVGSTHAYFVRNRHYSPELGRFLQRDPNATSQAVLGAMAYAGVGLDPTVDEADLADHLRDGVGVYWYVRASPLLHSDPLGLFSYGEVLGAAGVQGLLAGTITNALGGNLWSGFVGGALGGAAGAWANSAFAATAGGFLASLSSHALVGGLDGAVSGFVTTLLETKSWRYALADGAAGFVLGAATGGMVDVGGRAFFGRIAAARAQFASPSKLAEHVAKHSNEWTPALTQGQYLSRARHLLSRPAGGEILEKWRANGDMLRYNARTNEFAALDGETGAVKTLVRPKGGRSYWDAQ
jgi:hypothetical protein